MRLTRDRHNHSTGEITRERVFVITSLLGEEATPAQLADHIRGHWGIENRLHWVREVTYREDHSQIRAGNAAHAMASRIVGGRLMTQTFQLGRCISN